MKKTIESKIENLPNTECLTQHYVWFLTEKAGRIEKEIEQSKDKNGWENLGNLYSRILSFLPKGEVGCYAFGATSRDFLSYWGIRAYLIAGNEERAIEQLNKSKSLPNVIFTLEYHSGKLKNEPKEIKGKACDLPNLENFPKFYKSLKTKEDSVKQKYKSELQKKLNEIKKEKESMLEKITK